MRSTWPFEVGVRGGRGTALVRIPYRPADGLVVLNQQIWLSLGSKAITSSSTNGIKLTCKKRAR